MPHLLNVWPSVSDRFRRSDRVLVLFDFDGTLAPIATRPELATLPPETKQALQVLGDSEKFIVGVVSGRGLDDLRERVGLPALIYAGNHGLEIVGANVVFLHPDAGSLQGFLRQIHQRLRTAMAEQPGVIIEDKGLTLSVHFRLVSDDQVNQVEERFNSAVAPFRESAKIRVTRGKKVLEVRPNVDWNKGSAIAKIMEVNPAATLSVFFGDDLTDEDGFEVVQDAGGIAVFVGPTRQPTKAQYRVDSPRKSPKLCA